MCIKYTYKYLKKDSVKYIFNKNLELLDYNKSLFIYNNIIYNKNYDNFYHNLTSYYLYIYNNDNTDNNDNNDIKKYIKTINFDTILKYISKLI
jgi:hypothetical protein